MKREREVEYRDFFADAYGDALRFARRRSARERAEDAVADAMAVVETSDHAEQVARRLDLARAWRRLTGAEQEALSLAIFEQLTASQAARVLEISSVAFRTRLARARRTLHSHLSQPFPSHATAQIQEDQS